MRRHPAPKTRKRFPESTNGRIKHFKPDEFDYPHLMDADTLFQLEAMRKGEGGIYITINSDYREDDDGQHGWGKAIDLVMWSKQTKEPLPVIRQFFIALRYVGWTGVGFYLDWDIPGIHVDTRPKTRFEKKALWWRKDGVYRRIDEFFKPIYNDSREIR